MQYGDSEISVGRYLHRQTIAGIYPPSNPKSTIVH